MKKDVIRPFDSGSIILLIAGVIFPIALIYSIISVITKEASTTWIACAIISAALTYFISINSLRIVFMSKFEFYDQYVEITYFDTFISHISKNFYKIIMPQRTKVYYAEIDKFGSFEGRQMRKNGRDGNNISVLISAGGIPVPFKLPKSFDNTRNYFVINSKNESALMVDGKLYSVAQVKKILYNLEHYSGKAATGGHPDVPNMLGIIIIIGILAVVGIPVGLVSLECKINPTHTRADNPPARMIYFLSCMFLMISVLFNLLITRKAKDDDDLAEINKTKKRLLIVSLVLLTVVIGAFIVAVLQ
mgnify:FL=1